MRSVLFISFLLFFIIPTNSFTQGWSHLGNFPNDGFMGGSGLHGLAVDPEGKIWVTKLNAEYFTPEGSSDSIFVRLIYVFNPDGSQAEFSPIYKIQVDGITDTLFGTGSRGLRTDQNGNVIYVCQYSNPAIRAIYRINFVNGTGMDKTSLMNLNSPPTAPAITETGNVFVAPVVMSGNSVLEFTSDFTLVNTHLYFNMPGFTRSIECSDDGLTLYIPNYTSRMITVYHRLDEFNPFDSVGTIMDGVACESISFNKSNGKLWVSGGSYNDLPAAGSPWSPNTWYEYDVATGLVLDSIKWQINFPSNYDERPRAIDFSPDNRFAYVGCFGGNNYPVVQKFEREIIPVELTSFTASVIGSEVILNWSTASELNNHGFEVQRKFDDYNWSTIGFKEGEGTTTEIQVYSFIDRVFENFGRKIYYRLKQVDFDGKYVFTDIVEVELNPVDFALLQNYPNPFNPSTKISWQSPVGSWQVLKVFDVLGNEVRTLVNEYKPAGSYKVEFDAGGLTSGVYYYQIIIGDNIQTKKMILLR